MYHAVADVSCGCGAHTAVRECTEFTGVLASGGYASSLVHLSSTRPDGGFRLVSVLAPPTSFNPHLTIAPDRSVALYFRVNAVDPLPVCVYQHDIVITNKYLRIVGGYVISMPPMVCTQKHW
jgi:hypothetical protein